MASEPHIIRVYTYPLGIHLDLLLFSYFPKLNIQLRLSERLCAMASAQNSSPNNNKALSQSNTEAVKVTRVRRACGIMVCLRIWRVITNIVFPKAIADNGRNDATCPKTQRNALLATGIIETASLPRSTMCNILPFRYLVQVLVGRLTTTPLHTSYTALHWMEIYRGDNIGYTIGGTIAGIHDNRSTSSSLSLRNLVIWLFIMM